MQVVVHYGIHMHQQFIITQVSVAHASIILQDVFCDDYQANLWIAAQATGVPAAPVAEERVWLIHICLVNRSFKRRPNQIFKLCFYKKYEKEIQKTTCLTVGMHTTFTNCFVCQASTSTTACLEGTKLQHRHTAKVLNSQQPP